jgi:hypothetical protein
MIRMLGIIEDQPVGMKKSTWDHLKNDFQKKVGLGEGLDPVGSEDDDVDNDGDTDTSDDYLANRRKKIGKAMKKESLQRLVKEEYVKIQKEAAESAPKIEKKLHECREKMVGEFFKREKVGTTFEAVMEKRLQVNTVAEMIDVPINELILYFLNNVKTMNERALVEYRSGHVYFYAQ